MIKPAWKNIASAPRRFFKRNFVFDASVDHSASNHLTYIALLGVFIILPFFISMSADHDGETNLRLWKISIPGACLSRRIFGVRCPGCGLTRSFVALTHGNWREAFHFHNLGPALYFYFILLILFHAFGIWKKNQPLPRALVKTHQMIALIFIAALLLNAILFIR